MAVSLKVQVISTKYFMCINQGHYVIYQQNIKFDRLIFWPEGAYTDAMHFLIHESWLHRLIGKYPKWAKNPEIPNQQESLFCKDTARLPSITSQLVWSGPCLGGGVLFHYHFWWGGPLPPRFLGGSSSTTTSRGVLFHHHFLWGPCDQSHNALDVTCLLSRHQLMGLVWCSYLYTAAPVHHEKGHMGPSLNRLTDRQTQLKTLPSHTMLLVVTNTRCYLFALHTPTDGSGLMQLLIYCCPSASWERSHGTPELNRLTDRQTWLKTLPSRILRMPAVIIWVRSVNAPIPWTDPSFCGEMQVWQTRQSNKCESVDHIWNYKAYSVLCIRTFSV